MANPKGARRRGAVGGWGDGLDDIEDVRRPMSAEGSDGRERDDSGESGAMAMAMRSEKIVPTARSERRQHRHRHRRPSSRVGSEERSRRSARGDGREEGYVYGAPREKRASRRHEEVRVLGRREGKEGSMSVVSEEAPRRGDGDGTRTDAERPREHRRRRLTEEERAARRAAREARDSTTSVQRNKASSPRKELLQPLDFLRRYCIHI